MPRHTIIVRLNAKNTELLKKFAQSQHRSVAAQVNLILESYLPLYVSTDKTPITGK